jgi:hypothetical protein
MEQATYGDGLDVQSLEEAQAFLEKLIDQHFQHCAAHGLSTSYHACRMVQKQNMNYVLGYLGKTRRKQLYAWYNDADAEIEALERESEGER